MNKSKRQKSEGLQPRNERRNQLVGRSPRDYKTAASGSLRDLSTELRL